MKKNKPKKVLCPRRTRDLDVLTAMQREILLEDLMKKLDELSMDDFFGTEGWRVYLGYED